MYEGDHNVSEDLAQNTEQFPIMDLTMKPKYLVTFTVGLNQKDNIDAAVKKFSEDFQILLFHYDGRTSEWDEFEWSKRAVHISIRKQTKWWYAKRFLHPDVVASYDYIFIWDEDLGVENFNAENLLNNGSCVLSRSMAMCLAYDSVDLNINLFLLLGVSTVKRPVEASSKDNTRGETKIAKLLGKG
ncbi:hypothetical protein HAX54_014188 [Datura stramonium]|uniref:Uncharacterized protein n=1 Tax=Datura stramonium TaxID=4076 RepID=A0ABS8TPI7_DATST|nr:hypothetical protein [Datura stramonium]